MKKRVKRVYKRKKRKKKYILRNFSNGPKGQQGQHGLSFYFGRTARGVGSDFLCCYCYRKKNVFLPTIHKSWLLMSVVNYVDTLISSILSDILISIGVSDAEN